MTYIPEDVRKLAQELKAAYEKVKEWPENRMSKDAVLDLGDGFSDLLVLRNLVPRAIAAIMADRKVHGEVAVKPLEFGRGALCIDTGTLHDVPAVFIAPAKMPGEVGTSAKREGHPLNALVPGEIVMTFPTDRQARAVADALCNVLPPAPEAIAWTWRDKNDCDYIDMDEAHARDLAADLGATVIPLYATPPSASARIAKLEAHVEELRQKNSSEDCACSYDKPGDVCLGHSPALAAAKGRIAELEAEIAALRERLAEAKPVKDDESLWNFWNAKARDQARTIVELRARLAFLNSHTNLDLTWGEIDGWEDDCQWRIHREWTLLGYGQTVEQAIDAARAVLNAEGNQ